MCVCVCVCVAEWLGQPVGWCIADSEASEIIEIFLSSIKTRSPTTTVKVVMTDDGMNMHTHSHT